MQKTWSIKHVKLASNKKLYIERVPPEQRGIAQRVGNVWKNLKQQVTALRTAF